MPAPARRARGASMIEFTVAASALIALALAAIETAVWHRNRQVLAVAMLDAARAGSTAHLDPAVMAAAFEQTLLPLFAARGDAPQAVRQRLRDTHRRRQAAAGAPAWQIDVLSPVAAHFDDFGERGIAPAPHGGDRAIAPEFQFSRHAGHARRWPGGRGPASGQTIKEATVLRLRLRYLHAPLTPGIASLARWLGQARNDPAGRAMAHAGLLPIRYDIDMTLQTAALQWPAWAGNGGRIAPLAD